MIVLAILIALLIAVTGGMIVASYLIASTMLAGLSWVGLITGGIFTFLQLPLDSHTLGFFGVIMLFVVGDRGDVRMWLIKINLGRKKTAF
jgi:hypothetical protein